MNLTKFTKEAFAVIGKEGSTNDGEGFIERLWNDANSHFEEVFPLAKKDGNGNIIGIWGAMSDFSRSFYPWENNFTEGLYLAGIEADSGAIPPDGWTKWTIPAYEYLAAELEGPNTFPEVINYLAENGIPLVGAVHDHTCPATGKSYMFFPVQKL